MVNQISKADISDVEFLDAEELQSDGTFTYLTTTVVSTTSGTQTVVVDLPLDGEGILYGRDHPVQAGDLAIITGTVGGIGDGTFTVASILTDTSFTIVESIGDSTGGSVDFRYQAGALSIGVDPTNITYSTNTNVQKVLEDIVSMPPATQQGDLLASKDGLTFSVVQPVVAADEGWLANADAELLIEGLDP